MTQLVQPNYFNVNSAMSELLNAELKTDSYFHPNLGGITRGGMANHYPMTIVSMHALGASDKQLKVFKQRWPRHRALINQDLHLLDKKDLTTKNWPAYLGQSDKLKEFRRVFVELLAKRESAEVVTDSLKKMENGLPMGLFHPLIRLSFAAMHGDTGLLADALAYMAIRYSDIFQGEKTFQANAINMGEENADENWTVIRKLNQDHLLQGHLPNLHYRGSINICEQLCESVYVQELALNESFKGDENSLDATVSEVCKAAVKLYLFEPALTTLHAVTACQALADLTQRYGTTALHRHVFINLWKRMWVWLTALYIEKGCPAVNNLTDGVGEIHHDGWQKLSALALQTNEVHTIKMLFSCKWLFEKVEQEQLYYLAAQKMLGKND